jgi:hypothetical protein
MTRTIRWALSALILAVTVASLEATTARALSEQELATGAEIIAIGRCTSLRSTWEGRTLVTVATVAVDEVLKGTPGATVSVALPGGIDAARRFPVSVVWPGAPTMSVGEEVLLFLVTDDGVSSGPVVSGFSQGKFSIGHDASGRKHVSRDLTAITLQSGSGATRGTRWQKPLDVFKAEILDYLK